MADANPKHNEIVMPKFEPLVSIEELMRQQGITGPQPMEAIMGEPWTDEEGGNEDFDAWLREIRREPDRVRDVER